MSYTINEIAVVKRSSQGAELHVKPEFKDALQGITMFSHVQVVWWANGEGSEEYRDTLTVNPPYAPDATLGIFATRSQFRPNPLCVTACPIEKVDFEAGILYVANIDAYEDTPVMDIKGYYPVFDRVDNAVIPDWGFPMPDAVPESGVEIWE